MARTTYDDICKMVNKIHGARSKQKSLIAEFESIAYEMFHDVDDISELHAVRERTYTAFKELQAAFCEYGSAVEQQINALNELKIPSSEAYEQMMNQKITF